MPKTLTTTEALVERARHYFEWNENGETCRFEFESEWLMIRFALGHIMRDYEWGLA